MQTGAPTSSPLTAATTEAVVRALRRIIRAIDLHSRDLVQRYGVTGPQLLILKDLRRLQHAPIGELAKSVDLSHATVTGILDRLTQRGLVERIRSEADRRQMLVTLTQDGEELLDRTPPLLQEHFTDQFRKLQDWEQTQILSALQRVVAMMEAKDLDATAMLATDALDADPASGHGFSHPAEPSENPSLNRRSS